MIRYRAIIKCALLLLLLLTAQPQAANGQQKGLAEAAGITWKQVSLAPDWGIEVPAYWEEEKKLPPKALGTYRCDEVREFISLSLLTGGGELVTEAIRTSNAERSGEIMSLYAGWMTEAGAKKGEKVAFKETSIGQVGDYGALLLKYRVEYPNSLSLSFAQYMIPFNDGMYCMTISVDPRALDYIAMTLARRCRIGGSLGKNGGIPGKEIGKGYPAP